MPLVCAMFINYAAWPRRIVNSKRAAGFSLVVLLHYPIRKIVLFAFSRAYLKVVQLVLTGA